MIVERIGRVSCEIYAEGEPLINKQKYITYWIRIRNLACFSFHHRHARHSTTRADSWTNMFDWTWHLWLGYRRLSCTQLLLKGLLSLCGFPVGRLLSLNLFSKLSCKFILLFGCPFFASRSGNTLCVPRYTVKQVSLVVGYKPRLETLLDFSSGFFVDLPCTVDKRERIRNEKR